MGTAERLQALATKLINKSGNSITLTKQTGTTYDIALGQTVPTFSTPVALRGVYRSYKSEEVKGLIKSGDVELEVAFDPLITYDTITDIITIDNIKYTLIHIEPIKSDDVWIQSILQVRK